MFNSSNGLSRNLGCLRILVPAILVFLILLSFRYEIIFTWNLLKGLPQMMKGAPMPVAQSVNPDLVGPHFIYGGVVFVGLALIVAVMIFVVAKAALPTRTSGELGQTAAMFWSFLMGGQVWFARVVEGHLTGHPASTEREMFAEAYGEGVMWVDPNSAVLIGSPVGYVSRRSRGHGATWVGRSGLVFLRRGEHLRGVVSLRNQFRINLNVASKTGDGLEVSCHVFSIFSVSQPPNIYHVAYVGAQDSSNLQIIQIDPESKKIVAITDDLDDMDKCEIHRTAQIFMGELGSLGRLEFGSQNSVQPPFPVDNDRIFLALYTRARRIDQQGSETWVDMPAKVATEVFRNMLNSRRYDDLFSLQDENEYILQTQFKPAFARRMALLGVASYQVIGRQDGENPAIGQKVTSRTFYVNEVKSLVSSKVLRDRGIKVIHAGFTEITPVDKAVQEKRLALWRDRWQVNLDLEHARIEKEVQAKYTQIRAKTQYETTGMLLNLLKNTSYSVEALTQQVYQRLGDLATDPHVAQLLPEDALHILHNLPFGPDVDISPPSSAASPGVLDGDVE